MAKRKIKVNAFGKEKEIVVKTRGVMPPPSKVIPDKTKYNRKRDKKVKQDERYE